MLKNYLVTNNNKCKSNTMRKMPLLGVFFDPSLFVSLIQ